MSHTALLIGGPRDGEVLAVKDRSPLTVAYMDSDWTFWHEDDPTEVNYSTGVYVVKRLALFGVLVEVWAWQGLSEEECNFHAARHLLSDTAKRLIGERP